MNIKRLKDSIALFKKELDGALISSDIWDKANGLSIASYNPNEKYVALFTRLMNNMDRDLETIGFSAFGEYQLTDLEEDTMLLVVNFKGVYLWGSLLDKAKLSLGRLLFIAMPKAQESLKLAINDIE
ncbi:MAG TPA: hypothetical protein EYG92_05860 [Lutibacter sp.]|nr:hypothetical protein [Lutibacter sp.]